MSEHVTATMIPVQIVFGVGTGKGPEVHEMVAVPRVGDTLR